MELIKENFKYSNPVKEWGENFIICECNDDDSYIEYVMYKNGNIHYDLCFDRIIPNTDFAIVVKDEKYGIIDNNFKTIIELKYDRLCADYDNKLIQAQKNGKWGIIDSYENIILDLIYQDVAIDKYNNKYAFRVEYNNKIALFNEKGERVA